MRPGDFSPGNPSADQAARTVPHPRFNEAGGFLPRKLADQAPSGGVGGQSSCFNEAGGFLPRKLTCGSCARTRFYRASMRPGDFSPGNWLPGGTRRWAGDALLQ